jgi:superfamily I DNA and RNA helicase
VANETGLLQLRALLGYCDRKLELNRKVPARVLVALPFITEAEWRKRGFHEHPSCPPIIFSDQLTPQKLLNRIEHHATFTQMGKRLDDEQWNSLLNTLCSPIPPGPPLPPSGVKTEDVAPVPPQSRALVAAHLRDWLEQVSETQISIAWKIPSGPQRIRGIAGSGKTVLLCQKAALMHQSNPDWDIALVFFTRSLYAQAIELVKRWIHYFSEGEQEYDPATSKLKVLHAWGEDDQPGLYSSIRDKHKVSRVIKERLDPKHSPPQRLACLSKRLLGLTSVTPMFDTILIDEGQDLVVDDPELKYEDKQSIYWLAWQALRPVDPETPHQRRLIWAYDEAQSLDALIVPRVKEILGQELGNVLTQGTTYEGGAQKGYLMRQCYRTPHQVLTAAHAMGMGLLRPDGFLTGVTRKEHWEQIGYEVVEGSFKSRQIVTLHRPDINSPNPVPSIWNGPVIEFKTYSDRDEELEALAASIQHNLEHDQLKPSREILVVVLGDRQQAKALESRVAHYLKSQGINIYIPSATKLNVLDPQWPDKNANQFWYEGGVTVSRIHRAKGNEAEMVYVVGFDNVAQDESNITLRNQAFVALTRAKAWVNLSGAGEYPMFDEMRKVIESGDTFTFTFQRPPKRSIEEVDIEAEE